MCILKTLPKFQWRDLLEGDNTIEVLVADLLQLTPSLRPTASDPCDRFDASIMPLYASKMKVNAQQVLQLQRIYLLSRLMWTSDH